ncbi:MAG: TrkA C-terminal domain-containing protein [Candidatus Omnitrophica bacterium]|nr:TrkA C-terminal domain-containing protein [Candidatus Omnitrophota bacterium]
MAVRACRGSGCLGSNRVHPRPHCFHYQGSEAIGKPIRKLNVPEKCLIMLISRNDKFVIPAGSTVIQGGDVLLVLANREDFSVLHQTIGHIKKEEGDE